MFSVSLKTRLSALSVWKFPAVVPYLPALMVTLFAPSVRPIPVQLAGLIAETKEG